MVPASSCRWWGLAGSRSDPVPDLSFVRAWIVRYWLAVWFGTIFAMRFLVVVDGNMGFDARLYLAAT